MAVLLIGIFDNLEIFIHVSEGRAIIPLNNRSEERRVGKEKIRLGEGKEEIILHRCRKADYEIPLLPILEGLDIA